jgi:RHS repeat-associated protein
MPASGSNAGGSGHYSFGTFLFQVINASGHLAGHGLHQHVKLVLHYGKRGSALDIAHTFTVLNGPIPTSVNLDPSSLIAPSAAPAGPSKSPAAAPNTASASRTTQASPAAPSSPASSSLGPRSTQLATTNTTTNSLSTTAPMTTASTAVSWGTNAPVATFGKPDPFEVQLSGGSLTTGYGLDLPKGPGGFTPPLSLAYNSAGVNDQHNAQGAAPWVGEGWNMSLGAISWAEHNVLSGTGGAQWEDSWQLSDAFGTSAEIVPPNTNVATYYDDTPNTITPSPVGWHTVPETHTKIYSYVGPNSIPSMPDLPPCFRVFLTNGVMEEFGCTPGSLQYYPQPCGANTCDYLASWLLDLITDPQGNQIHITYQTDIASGYNAFTYPRDAVLATVEYDSPSCLNAQTACTGSAWTPLMRVNFAASHSVAHVAGSSCAANGNLRCDDPADLSGTGGLAAPTVQSTFVLNDVQTQVRASGTSGWNTLKDYQLGYDQAGPSTITDPVSGLLESTAGKLNLTKLSVVGDDGSTTLPAVNYAYTSQTEYYEDSLLKPTPPATCGPSWNTPCNLWSQTYAGNSSYLSSVSNGLGLAQSFTWQVARDNMHGVNGSGTINTQNPFYCNGTSVQSSYPCYSADDETWGRAVLTQRTDGVVRLTQAGQGGTQTSTLVVGTTTYNYQLTYPLLAQECADCVAGYSWGNQNDNDYLDFYNGKFMGFAQVSIGNPDGSLEIHKFLSTEGWGIYDSAQITCFENPPNPCHNDPWWDLTNAAHGHEYELDRYDANGTTLLHQVVTTYQAVCPAAGVSGSPAVSGYGNWNGNLVSELDLGNPVGVCDIQTKQVDGYTDDGSTSPSVPHQTMTYAYDTYGRVISQTDSSNDGGANGSPTSIVHKSSYIWNDAVTTTGTSATGTYLIDFPAFTDTEDSSANRYQCSYTSYDGHGNASGQSTGLTLGEGTRVDNYTACGNSGNGYTPSGQISITSTYDSYGNQLTSTDPDANAGNTAHQGCTVVSISYSACTTYDSTFNALATAQANALNQTSHTNYQAPASGTAAGGFGLWPVSTSDVNGQTTSVTYDALGRITSQTLPAEGTGLTTVGMSYTVWCSGASAQSPCTEVDRTQRLNSTTTVTYRSFYDGLGHLVETRAPAPGGQDVVQSYYYDPSQRLVFNSVPYFVTAYSGAPGSAAYSIPDSTQAGTSYSFDGIGRTTSVTDALSNRTATGYTVACNAAGTGDSACYEQIATVDPLGHQSGALTDGLHRANYEQRFTGNSTSNYSVYATTKYTYDYVGDVSQILQPDGVSKTTYQFDMAGRTTGMTDPDRGSETYGYDQNGNLIQSTDARGAAGTVYAGFDGLDRPIWRNTSNSSTGAYDTYAYDSVASGNVGIGRLTSETFSGSPNNTLSGSYSYIYDARGQQTAATLAIGSSNYPLRSTYGDAGTMLSQTYPNGETVTSSYTNQDWLTGVTTSQASTTLLSSAAYAGTGGASGFMTSANLGGTTYQYTAGFDLLARATDLNVKRATDQAIMFDQTRTFDASGNVSTGSTTLTAGTDNQAFCYDEQNRLTWAGSTATPPCIGTAISSGTLTSAQFTQSFAYDTMGRLTSGPLGAYSYGNTAHVHAATAIGGTYTAAYDPAGDMTCRAPSASATCNGTATGAQLTYNNEGNLANWQNQPSSPTSTATFLYDGQGNRAVQQATSSGSTTTTVYVGGVEEDTTTGSTTTKTAYYYANGQRVAMAVNGSFSYLVADGLGSANAVLNGSGGVTANVLYAPYGSARYTSGIVPTDRGFTGQIADATSGLDYYGARYYDSVAGQFASADTMLPGGGFDVWGLSRYAYVEGNPVIHTDPTGHRLVCECDSNASNVGNPQPSRSTQPNVIQRTSNVWNAVTQIRNIQPTEAQNNLISVGQQLHGSARSWYVSALSSSADWTGGETADLYSGDPRRMARGTAGAVLFAANFVPGGGEAAAVGENIGKVAVDEAISHASGAGPEATALAKWDADFAAKQLLGGNNITAGGRTITYHAADRIVNSGRGIPMGEIDSILNNGVRVTYNALANGGPTIRVFDTLGRSVVVDAETGMRVVTVIS